MTHVTEINPTELQKSDVVVAVMGKTGSGKSNFIDMLANQKDLRSWGGLKSATDRVQAFRFRSHLELGDRLVVMDTPGFDDTDKTDMEILDMIESWMKRTNQSGISLAAIIYLHKISDNRIGCASLRSLRMLGKLTGESKVPAKKVCMVSTMWDQAKLAIAEAREAELKKEIWQGFISAGASAARFYNSSKNAWEVLNLAIKHVTEEASPRPESGIKRGTDEATAYPQPETVDVQEFQENLTVSLKAETTNPDHTKQIRRDDIIIAVMGRRASGKTSFISKVASPDAERTLTSPTDTINMVRWTSPIPYNNDVVFVDTPGFDDEHGSDYNILQMISAWLEQTYPYGFTLDGLLYFHRISDNQLINNPLINLKTFRQLCPWRTLKYVILVTTMWDKIGNEIGLEKENELKRDSWKGMIDLGSQTRRFVGTPESVIDVISPILHGANRRNASRLRWASTGFTVRGIFGLLPGADQGPRSKLRVLIDRRELLLERITDWVASPQYGGDNQYLVFKQEFEGLREEIQQTIEEMEKLKLEVNPRMKAMVNPTPLANLKDL